MIITLKLNGVVKAFIIEDEESKPIVLKLGNVASLNSVNGDELLYAFDEIVIDATEEIKPLKEGK